MDCKLRRTSDWTTRATHEASLYDDNCFLTLTFSDDGLALRELQQGTHPYDLDVRDWQKFAKRLRKEMHRQARTKFRFFMVGEYGDQELRPHYHALIFGEAFRGDGEQWKDENGHPAWISKTVEKCWPYGFHEIKDATPETIGYVCKYVTKKLYGKRREQQCERIDSTSGECVTVKAEFATMSRGGRTKKGGIGKGWWDQWKNDAFPDDFVVVKGEKKPVPRYYTKLLEKENKELHQVVTEERAKKALKQSANNTPERRAVRAKVTKGKISLAARRKL